MGSTCLGHAEQIPHCSVVFLVTLKKLQTLHCDSIYVFNCIQDVRSVVFPLEVSYFIYLFFPGSTIRNRYRKGKLSSVDGYGEENPKTNG